MSANLLVMIWIIGIPLAVAAFCWHARTYAITHPDGFWEWLVTGVFAAVFGIGWPYCVPLCAVAYLVAALTEKFGARTP